MEPQVRVIVAIEMTYLPQSAVVVSVASPLSHMLLVVGVILTKEAKKVDDMYFLYGVSCLKSP
jgi:hypothetical protein